MKTASGCKERKPSPIPCLGHWARTSDDDDYDCDYENSGGFGCEDCCVNGGRMDPRTGKRFASEVPRDREAQEG